MSAARQYGVHRTCRVLGLDYAVLKRRVEANAAHGSTGSVMAPSFVELLPGGSAARAECVVELEEPSGARLRIELKGVAAPDLVTLTRSLRTGAS
jgi:hypothetical protein